MNISKIGDHNFLREPCNRFCKMKMFCPFVEQKRTGSVSVVEQAYEVVTPVSFSDMEAIPQNKKYIKCTCWGDGTGYQYDQIQRDVIGPRPISEKVYDIDNYQIEHKVLTQSRWNAWIEQSQCDYRFGRVSDLNAQCVLFPNVDNPWMFTEYVFKGIKRSNDNKDTPICKWSKSIPDEYIIEPPIYDQQTFELLNGGGDAIEGKKNSLDEKYHSQFTSNETEIKTKKCRQIITWYQMLDETEQSKINNDTNLNRGVKLYKASIPVQSIKWGEHGNIPPHTIDMTAPEQWFDPDISQGKIKAVYNAHVGYPLIIDMGPQVISWETEEGSDISLPYTGSVTITNCGEYLMYPDDLDDLEGALYYKTPKDRNGNYVKPATILMGLPGTPNLIHCGCALAKGFGGEIRCEWVENSSGDSSYLTEDCVSNAGNTTCPYYTKSEAPTVATYSTIELGIQQVPYNYGNILTGNADILSLVNIAKSLRSRTDLTVTYSISYQIEKASANQAQLTGTYSQGSDKDFGQGIQIVPGTGKYAIDSPQNANPFSGGDTNVFNDISVLSFHRFFKSVMHCATQTNCNEALGSLQKQGFQFGERAGGDGKCRYYTKDCPYSGVPKRAIEFAYVASTVPNIIKSYTDVYEEMTLKGAWTKEAWEISSDKNLYNKTTILDKEWLIFRDFAVSQPTNDVALIAVNIYWKDNSSEGEEGEEEGSSASSNNGNIYNSQIFGGASLIYDASAPTGYYLLAKAKTEGSAATGFLIISSYYWYQPLYNNGGLVANNSADIPQYLKQHVDNNNCWFCKAIQYKIPVSNCVMIDNEEKFIGGWHPQYKNFSKMGNQFIQEILADFDREGQGIGDYVQGNSGGGNGYNSVPTPVNKKGYWVDANGEYIIDECSTGMDQPIASQAERESNTKDGVVCISFKKSNTSIDSTTGEVKNPMTINAAVFSNDSEAVITTYRGSSPQKPEFDDPLSESGKYSAPCYVKNLSMLPASRKAIYCATCDYYLSQKYQKITTCPWCGGAYKKVSGSTEGDEGTDRGKVEPSSILTKFFKLNSLGVVDVWAPPGTCVKTDAYFWRHQANITQPLKAQLKHRIGSRNGQDSGITSQQLHLGYPQMIGRYYEQSSSSESMKNDFIPENLIPSLTDGTDERYIKPFSNDTKDGLKMVSLAQMVNLRNAIEPLYAYSLTTKSSQFPSLRASYYNREKIDQPIIYMGRRATIKPQILAYTSDHVDSYQAYFSGDYQYGNVREYFPSGYTWWYMKQLLGGRLTINSGGKYHMDDGGKQDGAQGTNIDKPIGYVTGGSGGRYTCGTKTVSMLCLSIYGMLPLDKEIVAAYVIVTPSGVDPSKDPVGLSWTGGPPMYYHYHAKKDNPFHFESGKLPHFHGTAGHKEGIWFDEYGQRCVDPKYANASDWLASNDVILKDESAYVYWGEYNSRLNEDGDLFFKNNFKEIMTGIKGMFDRDFYKNIGTPKKQIKSLKSNDENIYWGYDEKSFTKIDGFECINFVPKDSKRSQKYQYIMLNEENDIVVKYPSSQVWKDATKTEIQQVIDKNTVLIEFRASNGNVNEDVYYTFKQHSSELYGNYIPSQSQSISGYFDMSWTNTKGYVYGDYKVQANRKIAWDAPVIFQDGEPDTPNDPNNPNNQNQSGSVTRVLDVTDIVTGLYNGRIARTYSCQAGKQVSSGGSSLLNNSNYPILNSDGTIPEGGYQGDKYKVMDDAVVIKLDISLPITIEENKNDRCVIVSQDYDIQLLYKKWMNIKIKFLSGRSLTDEEQEFLNNSDNGFIKLKPGKYDSSNIKTLLETIFTIANDIQINDIQIKNDEYRIILGDDIHILPCPYDCYSDLGINVGSYVDNSNRILQSTNYIIGSPPGNIFNDGSWWQFDSLFYQKQSFVVDLLASPKLQSSRNWRYRAPSLDYSNSICDNCNMTFASAAAVAGRACNKSSSKCPKCGQSTPDAPKEIGGDNIETYVYYDLYSPDPLINSIQIIPLYGYNHGFRCFIKENQQSDWHLLWDVAYYNNSYQAMYPMEAGATSVTFNNTKSDVTKGRYIKVECDPIWKEITENYLIDKFSLGGYQVYIYGDFSQMEDYSFNGSTVEFQGEQFKVLSTQFITDYYAVLALNKAYTEQLSGDTYLTITLMHYQGGLSSLKINGSQYRTKESRGNKDFLTITPGYDIFKAVVSSGVRVYKLPVPPTQIKNVFVGQGDSGNIALTESNSLQGLTWSTRTQKIKVMIDGVSEEISIKRIIAGKYYYDVDTGNIVLPQVDGSGTKMSDFEKALREVNSWITFIPDALIVEYFSGNGKSITLKAFADGHGPSYMVQKDAINTIESPGTLPSNGKSCKIKSAETMSTVTIQNIPWIAYNNLPATLSISDQSQSTNEAWQSLNQYNAGQFVPPGFAGNELNQGNSRDYEKNFKNLYGSHCENCWGICQTQVTFVGAPNRVLSGVIKVTAPAKTEHTINVGGSSMTYTENTGGIADGLFVVTLEPKDSGSPLVTQCFEFVDLLIYAKDKNPYS